MSSVASTLVGTIFAEKYRIDRIVGEGGMGVVYAAHHLDLDEPVAIKLLHEEHAREDAHVARFLREGKASARIRSEHIVKVRDVGRLPQSGQPFMVMELLEGIDLSDMVQKTGPLSLAQAVDFVIQACDAIDEAHAAGIVHRDLKPSNLFLTRRRNGSPCVKVLDFGISKLATDVDARRTSTRDVFGSPQYMSPEQLLSSTDVDARADVWSMGIVLYELLAGQPPFNASSLAALHVQILQAALPRIPRTDVPPAVLQAISMALAKERNQRTPDVRAFAAALVAYASPVGQEAFQALEEAARKRPLSPSTRAMTGAPSSPQLSSDPALAGTQGTFSGDTTNARRASRVAIAIGVFVCLFLFGAAGIVASMIVRRSERAKEEAEAAAAAAAAASAAPSAVSATEPPPAATSEPEPTPMLTPSTSSSPASSASVAAKPPHVPARTKPTPSASSSPSSGRLPLPDDRR